MKNYTFRGYLKDYKRLANSVYGNPCYYGYFEDADGFWLNGKTASNAACAYEFLNYQEAEREITYHVTKSGNAIIDYIKILA